VTVTAAGEEVDTNAVCVCSLTFRMISMEAVTSEFATSSFDDWDCFNGSKLKLFWLVDAGLEGEEDGPGEDRRFPFFACAAVSKDF